MWTAKDVSCSKNSTFALMTSGELFCWGSSKEGILGLGDNSDDQYFPIKVIIEESRNDIIEVTEVSAGKNHVGIICREKEGESTQYLYMWGSNKYG
jgi:alpha-tubulin suppressor-like RCC1 family protein